MILSKRLTKFLTSDNEWLEIIIMDTLDTINKEMKCLEAQQ